MNYQQLLEQARNNLGTTCKACPICDGRGCRNTMPGPGACGVGDTAIRNYDKWQDIRINMDPIHASTDVDTSVELFGQKFCLPLFAGPVGSISLHYSGKYHQKTDDFTYGDVLVDTCAAEGIAAFVGDGPNPDVVQAGAKAIARANGRGVSMVKPWTLPVIHEKLTQIKEGHPFAICMDIDGAGLPILRNMNPPQGFKTVEELAEIAQLAMVPFIIKGVMSPKVAQKAVAAGAAGIVVSNHGGRALDQCPSTAEVLERIVDAIGGQTTILVDGGIRSGNTIFKALALGADGVLICRPFVTAFYGGEAEGIRLLINKLGKELTDTMLMCGASKLSDINRDMLWR